MLVSDIMTTDLFTLRPDHKLDLADDIMNWERIRHIPVTQGDNELCGLLTHRDLLQASFSSLAQFSSTEQRALYKEQKVREIMRKNVFTTTPSTDLRQAAATMIDEKVGCLLVVEEGKLVGIITEADFMELAWDVQEKSSS